MASGDPQAGRRRRPHHRRPHLVACQPRRCESSAGSKGAKGACRSLRYLKHDRGVEEIEKGFSAVKLALGGPPAPFFRFPFLKDPKDQLDYLGTRNIAVFSHDLDSFDFKMRKPEDVIKSVMTKLERKGKGIILMHDFQQATAKAVPDLLDLLKEKGYKVVHMKAKTPLATIAQWDEAAKSEIKGVIGGDRPTSSVIRTIDETRRRQRLPRPRPRRPRNRIADPGRRLPSRADLSAGCGMIGSAMPARQKARMTVDEFLAWAEGQKGRYELYNGVVYAMPPERAGLHDRADRQGDGPRAGRARLLRRQAIEQRRRSAIPRDRCRGAVADPSCTRLVTAIGGGARKVW